jgi:hypothetical protein
MYLPFYLYLLAQSSSELYQEQHNNTLWSNTNNDEQQNVLKHSITRTSVSNFQQFYVSYEKYWNNRRCSSVCLRALEIWTLNPWSVKLFESTQQLTNILVEAKWHFSTRLYYRIWYLLVVINILFKIPSG